jgi:hypothetical protein
VCETLCSFCLVKHSDDEKKQKTASDSVFMDRTPKLFLGTVCVSEVLKIYGHKCSPHQLSLFLA